MTKTFFLILSLLFYSLALAVNSEYCVSCERDSHGHIKRSQQAKNDFKRLNPCPSTNKTYGRCPGYIIDHIIALKRGGKDEPSNMQWQTIQDAKQKDQWE
jgi:hypothetical protein